MPRTRQMTIAMKTPVILSYGMGVESAILARWIRDPPITHSRLGISIRATAPYIPDRRQTAPYSPAPDSDHVLWTRKRLNHRTCRKARLFGSVSLKIKWYWASL
jgi:hypothetical protein